MEEQLLIAGCMQGESWARKRVYETYAPAMMSVCMRYVNDRETARDLLQDGFVKLFVKIHTYSGDGSFGGWIRRIFVNTALEHLRTSDALKASDPIDHTVHGLSVTDISPLDKLSADDLLACIAELPPGYRAVFNLYAIEGYSHKEVAGILEISEITSRTQFIRARNVLQQRVLQLMEQEDARVKRTY